MQPENWPDSWPIRVIQLLAIPGIVIAFFLLLYHNGQLLEVCKASGWEDCGKVSGPEGVYSSVGPIPVALIGLVGYSVIFLVAWLQDWSSLVDDYLPEIMVSLTGLAFLFSVGLTVLEIFVIHAICRYCVVSAVIITVMFILAISYLRGAGQNNIEPSS
jgi:uncharacterized membrane protein